MKSERDIEQSLKDSDLGIEINTEADRAVVNELVERHRASSGPGHLVRALELAAVIAILIGMAVVFLRHEGPEPKRPATGPRLASSFELARAGSLENAFRRGGIDAVERQLRKAFGTVQESNERPSIEELLTDVDTEMTDHRSKDI